MTGDPKRQGRDKAYCGGKKRGSDGTCTRPAGWGTDHVGFGSCKLHGGSTPNHRPSVQREQAQRAVETYGLPRDVNPVEALLEEVHWSAGHVAWLRTVVQSLEPESLVWGIADEIDRGSGEFPGVDVKRTAAPSVWLEMYAKERRYLLDVCRTLAGLGIEWERLAAIRRHGAVLAMVLDRVFADPELGLSPEQRSATAAVVARAIAAVTGVGAPVIEGSL